MPQLKTALLLILALILGLGALVALWAVVGALRVANTLVAIESAFGSAVIAALLVTFCVKALRAAQGRKHSQF